MSYLRRHWRGELPLPLAFWLNGVAGYVVAVALLAYGFGAVRGGSWPGLGLFVLFLAWQCVGIWRSADEHRRRGGWPPAEFMARAVVQVHLLFNAVMVWLVLGHWFAAH